MRGKFSGMIFALILALLLASLSPVAAQDGKPTKVPDSASPLPTAVATTPSNNSNNTNNNTNTNTNSGNQGPVEFSEGTVLSNVSFDNRDDWENYVNEGVSMTVEDGIYRTFIPGSFPDSYVWTLNSDEHSDAIIAAQVTQEADNTDSRYGIMCRADESNNGGGYYFAVLAEGGGFIGIGDEQEQVVRTLTDVVYSDAIQAGAGTNDIRAVCVGDYLALYVNGEFITETNDTTFTTGFAGIFGWASGGNDTEVTFDNVVVSEAVAGAASNNNTNNNTNNAALPAPSVQNVNVGDNLLVETFDSPDAWNAFITDDQTVNLRVEDGVFRAVSETVRTYSWALNDQNDKDVVVTVEASQQSDLLNNGYGLMCRGDVANDGDGYYFMISGDGYASIQKGIGGLSGSITPLVQWTTSDLVNQGQTENTITAVCVGDYLALYVNGELAAETQDSEYDSGYTGFSVVAFEDGGVDVAFDNLGIWEAEQS
jgi:hypothetical protein